MKTRYSIHVTKHAEVGLEFEPKKDGDVGHDLEAMIDRSDMGWRDRLVAFLFRVDVPMFVIWPFTLRTIGSGVRVLMPNQVWCEIKARSSAAKRALAVIGGVIDSGYTGELYTVLYNMSFRPRIVKHGERYSQVIFNRAVRPSQMAISAEVFEMHASQKERGTTGFGSTGV